MKAIKLKRATKRTQNAQLTVRFSFQDILRSWFIRGEKTIANKLSGYLYWLSRFLYYISCDLRYWTQGQNRGEVNIFAIIGLVYLGFMVVVSSIMF